MKQKIFSLLTLLLVGISSAWGDEFSAAEIATNPTGGTKKNHVTCSSSYTSTTNKKVKNVSNVATVSISNSADDSHSSYYIQIQADAGYTLNSPVTLRVASNNSSSVSFVAILWKGDFDDDKADAYQALTAPANSSTTDETATITFDASTYRTIRIYRRVNYVIGDNKKAQYPSSGSNTINIASVTATAAAACTDVAAPTSLSCTAHTKNSLTFGWTAAANASSYDVTLYDDSECTNEVATDNVTEVTKTFTGLNASKTYYCKVQSKGDGSTYCTEGNVTDAANGTTDNKDFTVTAASNNDVWGTAAAAAGSLDEGETTEVTATPESGYKFVSWAVSGEGATLSSNTDNPTTLTIGSANATVTATFRALSHYTITYNKGAYGTGDAIANGDKTEDADFTLTTSKYTRDGYVQTGWALTDGGSKAYDMGGTYTANEDLDLYPVWVELDAQTNISGATTWDWTTVTNGTNIDFGDEGVGSLRNVDVLFSNISKYGYTAVTAPAAFNQTALIMNGQRPFANANSTKHCQVNSLSFITTVAGKVSIEYANTGGNAARTVCVKVGSGEPMYGTHSSDGNVYSTNYVTDEFNIAAGTITIKGVQVSDHADKMLRIRKIVFQPTITTTIGSTGWSTFSHAEALDFANAVPSDPSSDALQAYLVGYEADALTKTSVNDAPAETGLLLNGTVGETYTIPVLASSSTSTTGNLMQASVAGGTVSAGAGTTVNYVLMNVGGSPVFQWIGSTSATLGANKAYLAIENGPKATSAHGFWFDDDVTSINKVEAKKQTAGEYYNLAGQRVAQPAKGLYIVNGRKVIIK